MKELIVSEKYEKKKLNTFLIDTFAGLSMNTIYKALRKKDIRVNDIKVGENIVLSAGDVVKIYISDELLSGNSIPISIDNIYEDDNILIVNKPAGIEVTGDNSLTSALSNKYSYISPCHRIDRNTRGLVLFAKNEECLKILLDKFKNHEIEKHYIAKVYGIVQKESDILRAHLFKDRKKSIVYISDVPKNGYVQIITSYTVLEKNKKENYSLLDVELHTGKTHQIRAHLAHIGHPIIGDGKYGINEVNKRFKAKNQDLTSYSLKFAFKTDAGKLNYLNESIFKLQ